MWAWPNTARVMVVRSDGFGVCFGGNGEQAYLVDSDMRPEGRRANKDYGSVWVYTTWSMKQKWGRHR